MAPKSFDLQTAATDFAAPGRDIECPAGREVSGVARRQMLLKVNGWTFSAVWGFGTYCSGAREGATYLDAPPTESPDAEIAVWRDEGTMIQIHDDTVEGWVLPASFLSAVEAAERDDEDAIRAALVRRQD